MKPAPEKAPDAAEMARDELVTSRTGPCEHLWKGIQLHDTPYRRSDCGECVVEALRAYARDEFKKLAGEYREKRSVAMARYQTADEDDTPTPMEHHSEAMAWQKAAEMAEKRAAGTEECR